MRPQKDRACVDKEILVERSCFNHWVKFNPLPSNWALLFNKVTQVNWQDDENIKIGG